MSRLFAFGCSFTNYHWPTWADFYSTTFDEYYNYAKSGGGNRFIFERLVQADVTHTFTPDDTIAIMWSTHQRHDFYKDDQWVLSGNLYRSLNNNFDAAYIEKYVDIKGFVLHTLNYIYAAQKLLANSKATWWMSSIADLTQSLVEETWFDFSNQQTIFTEFPDLAVYEKVFDQNWLPVAPLYDFVQGCSEDQLATVKYQNSKKTQWQFDVDDHPTAGMHYDWLNRSFPNIPQQKELLEKYYAKFPYGEAIHLLESMDWNGENINCVNDRRTWLGWA